MTEERITNAENVTYSVTGGDKGATVAETKDPRIAARAFLDVPAEHGPAIIRTLQAGTAHEAASVAASTWSEKREGRTTYHKTWSPQNGDPELNNALDAEQYARKQRGRAGAAELQDLADRIAPITDQGKGKANAEQAPKQSALDDPDWKKQIAALRDTTDAIQASDRNARLPGRSHDQDAQEP
jgi:hypothetical protein